MKTRYGGEKSSGIFDPLELPTWVKKNLNNLLEIKDPTPGISLTEEQIEVKRAVENWIKNPDPNKRVLTVGGYAGTGKTTLIRHIQAFLEAIALKYAIAAFTGKAVSVLRKKKILRSQTLHSLIYNIDEEAYRKGKLKFIKKAYLDERIVVVDEGGMVNKSIDEDLRSFSGSRILYVGDHGQLEPVGDDPY